MVMRIMHCEQIAINNGLKVLFIHAPGNSSGSVQIWFRAGSALESPHNRGIAHFLEHMFFKGSQRRSGDDIARAVESFGGELNAFTSFDYTCYYINTPGLHIPLAVDILMDMVANPQFKEEEIPPEKDVVFEEYLGSLDNPGSYAFNQLQKACFTKGYAHPILGSEKTIKNFHRKQLLDFRKKFYNRNNCMLIVAGDLQKKKKIISQLKHYSIPSGNNNIFPSFQLRPLPCIDVHARDVHHCQLTLAINAPSFQKPDAPAEDLAMTCLGHGESSMLYKFLVAKNTLADQAGASTTFMNNGGFHLVKIIFPYDYLNKILVQTKNILFQATAQGFSHVDIRKVKNQYLDSKIYDKELLESFAFSQGQNYAQTGHVNSEEEYLERIEKTTINYVNQSLKNIFSRSVHISLQIPQDENTSIAKKCLHSFAASLNKINQATPKNLLQKKKKPISSKVDPSVKKTIIKKGVTFLHRKNSLSPTFVLHAYISSGHAHENKKNEGSHSLIAQLLTRGYNGIPLIKLKESLENYSASLSGFAGKNAYGLTLHGQIRHFDELIEHFSGCLLFSDMKPNETLHFKKIFMRTLEKEKKDPYRICFKTVKKIMFQNHPYSQEAFGTTAGLKKINASSLISLHQANLKKKNILISCFGDVEYEQAFSALVPLFSSFKERAFKLQKRTCIFSNNSSITHLSLKREQVHFFTGIATGGFGLKEHLYLKIITAHLSRFSSELFKTLREKKGLCYSSHPVHYSALEAGYWGIYVASSVHKIDLAIKSLKNIIAQLKKNGLSKKNFHTAKNIIEGKELLNLQTNEDHANLYSITALHGYNLDFHHTELATIKNLTYPDFQRQLAKVLSRKWQDIYVGP